MFDNPDSAYNISEIVCGEIIPGPDSDYGVFVFRGESKYGHNRVLILEDRWKVLLVPLNRYRIRGTFHIRDDTQHEGQEPLCDSPDYRRTAHRKLLRYCYGWNGHREQSRDNASCRNISQVQVSQRPARGALPSKEDGKMGFQPNQN